MLGSVSPWHLRDTLLADCLTFLSALQTLSSRVCWWLISKERGDRDIREAVVPPHPPHLHPTCRNLPEEMDICPPHTISRNRHWSSQDQAWRDGIQDLWSGSFSLPAALPSPQGSLCALASALQLPPAPMPFCPSLPMHMLVSSVRRLPPRPFCSFSVPVCMFYLLGASDDPTRLTVPSFMSSLKPVRKFIVTHDIICCFCVSLLQVSELFFSSTPWWLSMCLQIPTDAHFQPFVALDCSTWLQCFDGHTLGVEQLV